MDPKGLSEILKSLDAIEAATSTPNFLSTIASMTSAVFTAIAAWAAWRSVKQVEKTRMDDFMPIVTIKNARPDQKNNRFHPENNPHNVDAILENLGKGVAKDVRIIRTNGDLIFTKSISIPVGHPVHQVIDFGPLVYVANQGKGNKRSIPFFIEYRDIYEREYKTIAELSTIADEWFDFSGGFTFEAVNRAKRWFEFF